MTYCVTVAKITPKQMAWCIQSVSMLLVLSLSRLISLKHHHRDWLHPLFQDAFAHFAHIHNWQDLNSAVYKRGGGNKWINYESGWWDSALRRQRCSENVGKTRGGGETSKKMDTERKRFGRSKIIVTLSLDSTHYFSIQWAQCWGDMAEIQLQNTFDSGSRDEAVDLQCHTVSA